MGDKNPKHPLKKKKVTAKTNIAPHEEDGSSSKKKKHVYE